MSPSLFSVVPTRSLAFGASVLIGLVTCGQLVACGQKGPLYLPQNQAVPNATQAAPNSINSAAKPATKT